MSEDIKKEIETQITGTRISIMKEIKNQIKCFYISVIGMIFCLMIGFYIGSSQLASTKSMIYHTQKKIDLILNDLNLKYHSK